MSPQFSLKSPRSTTSECRAHDLESRLAKIADGGSHAINERLVALDTEWSAGRVSQSLDPTYEFPVKPGSQPGHTPCEGQDV